MNIYSNAFFHRVDQWSSLSGILEDGFKAHYCKEEVFLGKGNVSYIGIPMVCYCDIPLTYIARNNYGKCGIAMKRTWGISRHLEPVLYYPNDIGCQSTKMIIKAANAFSSNRKNADAYRILGYSKPVRKVKPIAGRSSDNYIEREWRRVYANPAPLKWLTEVEYNTYRGPAGSPKTPVGTPLVFSVDDIEFVIIDKANESNLKDFIMNRLVNVGGRLHPITLNERCTLLSKVIVYESLKHNI